MSSSRYHRARATPPTTHANVNTSTIAMFQHSNRLACPQSHRNITCTPFESRILILITINGLSASRSSTCPKLTVVMWIEFGTVLLLIEITKKVSKLAYHFAKSPGRYGKSNAMWDHTVLPATLQRLFPRLTPAEVGTLFSDPGGMQG